MSPAQGWAVAVDGQILIRSVMDTQSAAAVNWISLQGGRVMPGTSPETILEFFAANAPAGTELVPVTVSLKLDG